MKGSTKKVGLVLRTIIWAILIIFGSMLIGSEPTLQEKVYMASLYTNGILSAANMVLAWEDDYEN